MTVKLECSKDAFHRLHLEANRKRRKGTKTVPVLAADLQVLLRDHSTLIAERQDRGLPIIGPGVDR